MTLRLARVAADPPGWHSDPLGWHLDPLGWQQDPPQWQQDPPGVCDQVPEQPPLPLAWGRKVWGWDNGLSLCSLWKKPDTCVRGAGPEARAPGQPSLCTTGGAASCVW